MNASSAQNEVQLGELCERVTVGHVGPMAAQYQSEGIPFLRSQDIRPFVIDTASIKFIDGGFNTKLKKSILAAGDVVIVRTGYPGTAAIVPPALDGANCADLVILTPGPNLDAWFTVSLLNSSWGRGAVAGNLVGVAQQHFNVGAAKTLRLRLPPLSVQRRIGEIVKAYCDLIEVNTRRIAILEEMARRLFDEWFGNFFSPGDRQKVFTQIPNGWKFVSPHDLAEVLYGHPFKSKAFNSVAIGRPVIRIRDIKAGKSETYTEETAKPRYLVKDRDILIGMDGEFHMAVWSGGDAWLNQRVARLRPRDGIPVDFLFHLLRRPIKELESSIMGTTVAHLSAKDIDGMRLLSPRPDLLERCNLFFDHCLGQRIVLMKTNSMLRTARDLLLPKLISGEINLSGAERQAKRVVKRAAAE